jgi:hypothetical protein
MNSWPSVSALRRLAPVLLGLTDRPASSCCGDRGCGRGALLSVQPVFDDALEGVLERLGLGHLAACEQEDLDSVVVRRERGAHGLAQLRRGPARSAQRLAHTLGGRPKRRGQPGERYRW